MDRLDKIRHTIPPDYSGYPCKCDICWLVAEVERLREQLRLANIDQTNTEAELNAAIEVNHSVPVCSDHTGKLLDYEGCVICDIERAKRR